MTGWFSRRPDPQGSDVTQRYRLLERRQRIPARHELVGDVSLIPDVRDCLAHRSPVELLGIVQLMAPGHATGMKVSEVRDVVANGPDDVALP